MKALIWILRAAMEMRRTFGWWRLNDLAFCWETAEVLYQNFDNDDDRGDPVEAMAEELTYWGD